MKLNERETATVLAALRLWQESAETRFKEREQRPDVRRQEQERIDHNRG